MTKIRAGIIGGAGYTGGEMIRVLINHPGTEMAFVYSKSNAGKYLYEVHEDLAGETQQRFDADWHADVDVLLLCLGHGDSRKFVEENAASLAGTRIIDLSQDFRLHTNGKRPGIGGQAVIYGLPELNRDEIRKARHVANPGCFATALQLGLLPLAKAGLLGEVSSTGITGSTGAGQSLSLTSHFSWRANNVQAYKTLTHQHLKEVTQSLQQLQPSFAQAFDDVATSDSSKGGTGLPPNLYFVPWRGDFTRGIFISSQLRCDLPLADVVALYEDFYNGHPFTVVSRAPISLKQVVNTNKCLIQLEQQGNRLVVHSAVDNLLKGASGQAVQNMNLMFGLDEAMGLRLKANAF